MKTRQFLRLWSMLLVILLLSVSHGYAQNDEESGSILTTFTDAFDGYLKNSTAVRLDEPDQFVKIENSLQLGFSKNLTDKLGFTVTALGVYDAVYDVEDDLEVEDEEEYRAYVDLREAFVDLTFEKFDLRLGKQQIVWGKTDGVRVLDVANPLDFKEFILADFLDSRIPLWMGKLEYYFTFDYSFQLLVIPEMQFTELAHAGSEYEMNTTSSISEGISLVINDTDEPDENFENTEYGLKFTGYRGGWDFTMNYLYTWDDDPALKGSFDAETGSLTISPEQERLHIVGGSVANVLWNAVVRGELAAKIGKYFSVDDLTVPDMVVEKTLLSYALAFERDLWNISWLLQCVQGTILDYEDDITNDQVDSKISLQGSKTFMSETLNVTLFTLYGVNESEFSIRPSIEYDATDSVKVKAGADLFEGGEADTLIGQFDDKDRLYVELKYSF